MANAEQTRKRDSRPRCRAVRIDVVIDEKDFDPSALAAVISKPDDLEWNPTKDSVSGPLRLGGRGREAYRLYGRIDFHSARDGDNHFLITAAGTVVSKPISADKSRPTVKAFFGALTAGIRSADSLMITVFAEHTYPPDWWVGQTLPVPISSGEGIHDARLTGVEITYGAERGHTKVLVSSGPDSFGLVTFFAFQQASPDLFQQALQHTHEIAGRLFVDPSGE